MTKPKPVCHICNKTFAMKCNLTRHLRNLVCQKDKKPPPGTTKSVPQPSGSILRNPKQVIERSDHVLEIKSAFNKYLTDFLIQNNTNKTTIRELLEHNRPLIKKLLTEQLNQKTCIKSYFVLDAEFETVLGETLTARFKTGGWAVYIDSDLDAHIERTIEKLEKEMETTVVEKSGWMLSQFVTLHILCTKYQPIRSGSYIALPDHISLKHATVNPVNKDAKCFKYACCVGYAYETRRRAKQRQDANNKTKPPKRINLTQGLNELNNIKKYAKHFDFSKTPFPTSIRDVQKFMKVNKHVAISIFSLGESGEVFPVKVYDGTPREFHFDLLLLQDDDNQHYVFITDFNRLVSTQINRHNGRVHVCRRCLVAFRTEQGLLDHKTDCMRYKAEKVVMPEIVNNEIPKVYFKDVHKQIPHDLYGVVDFEAELQPIEHCCQSDDVPNTTRYQQHNAFSYGFKLNSRLPAHLTSTLDLSVDIYRGKDAPERLLRKLLDVGEQVENFYKTNVPIKYGKDGRRKFDDAICCYLCKLPFTDEENPKVADHHHITGRYRGAAHNECNLKCQAPSYLPVLIHNLPYDSSFLIEAIDKVGCRVEVIATSQEKFITMGIYSSNKFRIQFIDSFRFLPASLDSLAKNLPREEFYNVMTEFPNLEQQNLAVRKGVFCYDYISDTDKLGLDHLPPKSDFHNKLTESEISDEDYAHAQQVWDTFNISDLGEYSDLYLKIDCLLLADIFERFRNVCLANYGLDPLWYLTSPGLAFDSSLKVTGQKLDLLTDYNMLMMIQSGIRGGITTSVKRYAEACNSYVSSPEDLIRNNCEEIQRFLLYLDANNLYGWSMSEYLPTGGFQWVVFKRISDILHISNVSDVGYIFECDVTYPESLHDEHADLPFLPENLVPPNGKYPKLLTTLYHKKKYVAHYRTLQQAMRAGLIVTKIRRTLRFNQSPWLKSYITLNTVERMKATNDFDKDFFKLMNNSVYGKTMEDVRKRINLKLVCTEMLLRRYTSSPLFKFRTILGENLSAIQLRPEKIEMNKPIYVGFAILEIS